MYVNSCCWAICEFAVMSHMWSQKHDIAVTSLWCFYYDLTFVTCLWYHCDIVVIWLLDWEGIVLINTLSSTKDRSTVLKAVLYNQSDRDIILDPHMVQAEVHVVESTTSLTDAKDNIRNYLHSVEENVTLPFDKNVLILIKVSTFQSNI